MPEISIIVPVYNVEKYLDRCIKSILNQTFKDFELILIDDGSTDKSGVICDNYKKIDDRIVVIHKKNGGLSSVRNKGLDVAKGEYIAFVDGDDYVNKEMYNILLNEAKNNSSDIVICKFKKVYESMNNNIEEVDSKMKVFNYSNINALNQLYSNEGLDYIVAWNKIYRRNIFKNERYIEGRIHEDEFIIHRLLYKANKVTFISKELYYYLQRSNSIMNSKFNVKRLDAVYALEERFKFFKTLNLNKLKSNAQYWYIKYFFDFYYRCKESDDNYKDELKNLKRNFVFNIPDMINNNKFSIKEKLAWIIFAFNDRYYEKIILRNK